MGCNEWRLPNVLFNWLSTIGHPVTQKGVVFLTLRDKKDQNHRPLITPILSKKTFVEIMRLTILKWKYFKRVDFIALVTSIKIFSISIPVLGATHTDWSPTDVLGAAQTHWGPPRQLESRRPTGPRRPTGLRVWEPSDWLGPLRPTGGSSADVLESTQTDWGPADLLRASQTDWSPTDRLGPIRLTVRR